LEKLVWGLQKVGSAVLEPAQKLRGIKRNWDGIGRELGGIGR
jgi:hypothetical protein